MKKTIPFLFCCLFFVLVGQLGAQNLFSCGSPTPPGAIRCTQSCIYCDLDGFTDTNDQFLPNGTNVSLCLGSIVLENPRWYGFIAGTSTVVIGIEYLSCQGGDGLQAAVLTDCNLPVACAAGPNPGGGGGLGGFSLSLNNLTVGAPYQLLLDGLNGDICNYTITVQIGSVTPLPLGPVGTLEGLAQVCPNGTTRYSIPPVANAVSYTWTAPFGAKINGAGNVLILPAANGNAVDITFATAGGNVCVTASNACSAPVTRCLAVANTPLAINVLEESVVCYSQVPYEWPEEPHPVLAVPGTYILTSSPYLSYLGCDSIVRQKVRVLPLNVKNLPPVYLCEGECFSINGFEYCENGTNQEVLTSFEGCDSIVNFTTIVIPIKAVVQQPDTITCAKTSVVLTSVGSTVGNGVLYQWFNSAGQVISNTNTAVATASGEYSLVLTRAQGGKTCYDTATVFVPSDLNVPQASAGPPQVLTCTKLEVQLQGSGSVGSQYSYFWTATNGGNIVSGSTTLKPIVNAPGTYRLRVTNNINGCTTSSTTSVIALTTPPAVTVGGGTYTCTDPQVVIQTTTNATTPGFSWTGPNGFTSTLQNPIVNQEGSYFLTVTDGVTGCTATRTAVVIANNTPPGATATSGSITCVVQSVTLNGVSPTNGTSFLWTGPNGFNAAIANPTATTPGVYNLLVTGTNGCTSTATTTLALNTTAPGAVLTPSGNLNCNNATINLIAASTANPANLNHVFIRPNGLQDTTGTVGLLVVNAAGAYIVQVTNTVNGCVSQDTASVIQYSAVSATLSGQTNNACFGDNTGGITASAAGGNGTYTYAWSNSGNTAVLNNLAGGTYTVTITDGENCTSTAVATITEPAILVCNASATPQTANGLADGTASAAPSGGTPVYTYQWNTLATTATITGLLPGFYTVTVTDGNGCTKAQTISVSQYDCAVQGTIQQANVRCYGNANGSASVTLTGGNTPYTYAWSNGASTSFVSNLGPDTYTVTVTDANNCPVLLSFTITEPDTLIANVSTTGASGPNTNNGTATANPSGGSGVYTYLWNNGATTAAQDSLPGGTYTVTVFDSNGCSDIQTVEVEVGNCNLLTSFLTVNPACFGTPEGQATIVLTGGANPFNFQWSSGDTTATADSLAAGDYLISVTDDNGCQIVDSVTIVQPNELSLSVDTVINTVCTNSPLGVAGVQPNGGTGIVSVQWSNNQTGLLAVNLVAGTYTAIATDENGCTAETSAEVIAVDTLSPTIVVDTIDVPLGPSGNVTLTVQNLNANVSDNCTVGNVAISPNSFNCTQLGLHTVFLVATDNSGNTSSASTVVNIVDNSAPVLICPQTIIRCFGNTLVQYNAPTATDNCLGFGGGFALVEGLPSGSIFPLGTTLTTYAYTDGQGNVGSCSFEVTILTPLSVSVDSVYNDIENTQVGRINMDITGSLSPYTYQWFKNGQPIALDTEDLTGLGVGTYTVIVTDANGCSATSAPATVISVVGTETPSWTQQVGVYPNPTTGLLTIALPDNLSGKDLQLAVYDLTGRKLMAVQSTVQNQFNLDLHKLAAGMYSLLIQVDGVQMMRKVVLSK